MLRVSKSQITTWPFWVPADGVFRGELKLYGEEQQSGWGQGRAVGAAAPAPHGRLRHGTAMRAAAPPHLPAACPGG
jgi:hypothetical protein